MSALARTSERDCRTRTTGENCTASESWTRTKFKYDPFGRRIYKSSSNGTSIFAYDGDDLVEETNSSGAVGARYSQGLNVDEPLAMLRSSTTSYYHADGLGSVTSLTSVAGSLIQTYGYDSFGKQTGSSGSLTNPFQYTARESDAETSLYFYRARYYDPGVGRFMNEDPADFGTGTNFYNYAANNPTVLIDPFGLWHCAANVNCNFTPGLKKALLCFDKCTGLDTAITGGLGKRSKPGSSHSKGEACDVGRNSNPTLPRDKTERCFLQCFPTGYGQEENNDPANPGTHFHFQENTVPGGRPRFAPGIQPYAP
jgi:RHS repeat-associated protein